MHVAVGHALVLDGTTFGGSGSDKGLKASFVDLCKRNVQKAINVPRPEGNAVAYARGRFSEPAALGANSTSEPRDHRQMDAVALRNRGQSFAGSAALDRFGSLVVAQLALAAEFDAGGHRALPPFASTLTN
jgi:hypothetical protein